MRTHIVGRTIALCLGLLAGANATPAFAETCRWTGAGPNNLWSSNANWTNCRGLAPVDGDAVVFPAGVPLDSRNDIVGLRLISMLITGAPGFVGAYNISGVEVTLAGTLTITLANQPGSPHTLLPIALGTDAQLSLSSGSDVRLASVTLSGFNLTVNPAAGSEVSVGPGQIGGTGTVTKTGAGLLAVTGNTYAGITRILDGVVRASGSDAFGATGIGNETIVTQPGVLAFEDGATLAESIVISGVGSGAGAISVPPGASVSLTGPFNLSNIVPIGGRPRSGTVHVDTNATLLVSGRIATLNDQSIIKVGAGTLTMSSPANAWSRVALDGGTLRLGAAGAWSDTGAVQIGTDGLLDLNGQDETVGSLSGTGGRVRLGAGTLTINQTTPGSFAGIIEGTGGIRKTGAANLTFFGDAANRYTGTTRLSQGSLFLQKIDVIAIPGSIDVDGGTLLNASPEQIADTAAVTIDSPGQWILNDHHEIVGSLAGSGGISLGTGGLTVGANNSSTTYSGAMSGAQPSEHKALGKVGLGTLTLTGQQTYTGATWIDGGGALVVNGSLPAGGTLLYFNGTVGGTGQVGRLRASLGGVPVGAVSPGTSPGILRAADATLRSRFIVELNGPAAGTGYDQLQLAGGLTLGEPALVATRGFAPRRGATFTIISVGDRPVTGTFAGLPEGATLPIDDQDFTISYRGGDGNDVVLTAIEEAPVPTYFLSEGATGAFFDEDVLIANPNAGEASVTLTFFKESGEQVVAQRTIAAMSHIVVHVDQIPGLEAAVASVRITSTIGRPLVVERSMFWDARYYAGHTGSAVERPSADWFFAEGAQGFFDTFLLVINPNATAADVTFTFVREDGPPIVTTMPVGAGSRLTLGTGDVPDLRSRVFGISVHATQPIMAERAMYFGSLPGRLWGGGHASAGAAAPSTSWFLAEGATGSFFDTFILLSNPQREATKVTLQFLLPSGESIPVTKTIAGESRLTVNPEDEGDERLRDAAVSTVVTSDLPIVAERSMYWRGATVPWGESHNSFGVTAPGTRWGLAEGRVGGRVPFATYILLANPQTTEAKVTVSFLRESGAPVVRTYTVPPTSRFNIEAAAIEDLRDSAFGALIEVTNDVPIIVERSMYWDADGIFWSGGTNATGIRLAAPAVP